MRVLATILAFAAILLMQGVCLAEARSSGQPPGEPCETHNQLHHDEQEAAHCDHAAAMPAAAKQIVKAVPQADPPLAVLSATIRIMTALAEPTRPYARYEPLAVLDPPQLAVIRVTRLLI
ncbi:hypothetical protein sos41_26850 [Alphaproteobacteria bacterium SO-S41]|nr:hypothetical protein sos41_26850 [Alphaproteobacteria bacterium SO-S41]